MKTLLVFFVALPAFSAEYAMQFTPANTQIHWTLGDPLHTVHGTFTLKSGRIVFDPESGKASGKVTVNAASGESGGGTRDKRMHQNVLESAKFPDAVFTPDLVEGVFVPSGDSTLKFHGMLSIHGDAHPIVMEAKIRAASGSVNAAITSEIPYVKWGMKDPSNFVLKVSKTVSLSIETSGSLERRSAVP